MSTLALIVTTLLSLPAQADTEKMDAPAVETASLRKEHERLQHDYGSVEYDMENCRRETKRLRRLLRRAEGAERRGEGATARSRTLSARSGLRYQERLYDDLRRQRDALYREMKDLESRVRERDEPKTGAEKS